MPGDSGQTVFVEAPARLHFGVPHSAALGRWSGGIGAAAPAPTLLPRRPADTLTVEGEDADRAMMFARRFPRVSSPAAAPRFAWNGLFRPTPGSFRHATRLAVDALAEILTAEAPALARAVGRGERSAIGT